MLGISFRPRQVEAFGLNGPETLDELLAYPFDLVRVAAYWNHIQGEPGEFDTDELDWQLEAIERSGKQAILSVGAVKTRIFRAVETLKHRFSEGEASWNAAN